MTSTSPTPPTPPTGTVDITNLIASLQKSFVTWAVAYIYGLEIAVPGMEWMATPIISSLDKDLLKASLDLLSTSVIMQAFFLNTAIKKASQAQDYVAAVTAKTTLPPTSSPEDFKNAEAQEMAAFRNFVMLTN